MDGKGLTFKRRSSHSYPISIVFVAHKKHSRKKQVFALQMALAIPIGKGVVVV